MKKKCGKCLEEKSVDEFWKDADKKDGLRTTCKCCKKESDLLWRKNNPERVVEKGKRYRASAHGKKVIKAGRLKYFAIPENKAKREKYIKKYRKEKADEIAVTVKAYSEENWEGIREYKKNWSRERYAKDPLYRLATLIRSASSKITKLVKNGITKSQSSLKYLGCSLEEYKVHIESQWKEGMSWENHSFYGWHIDHIIPIDWFIKNSDDPWEANHYTNRQPLWWDENLSKGNKII